MRGNDEPEVGRLRLGRRIEIRALRATPTKLCRNSGCAAKRDSSKASFGACALRAADGQDIRRPATVQQLADESGCSTDDVISVVEAFRRTDRCFLMPPAHRELTPDTKIDISHEALIRQWQQLGQWLKAEENGARLYRRLVSSARLRQEGGGGLLKDPELAFLARWWNERQPNAAWADRYEPAAYQLAERFLRESEAADAEEKRQEAERRSANCDWQNRWPRNNGPGPTRKLKRLAASRLQTKNQAGRLGGRMRGGPRGRPARGGVVLLA